MTATINPTIRPPWPDELSRVWKFLRSSRQMKGRVHPRIAVSGEPERIVAAAALQIEDDGIGRLYLSLRTRFSESGLAAEMLRAVEEIARGEGLREVGVILPEAAPWRPSLEADGFVCTRTDEWWLVERDAQFDARLQKIERLVGTPKLARGLTLNSPGPDDYPEVRAIAEEHGLANLERMGQEHILGNPIKEYDSELSAVVRLDGAIAGILLVKNLGDRVFVHVRAVAKKHAARSNAINAHLMARFGYPGYRDFTCCLFPPNPPSRKKPSRWPSVSAAIRSLATVTIEERFLSNPNAGWLSRGVIAKVVRNYIEL